SMAMPDRGLSREIASEVELRTSAIQEVIERHSAEHDAVRDEESAEAAADSPLLCTSGAVNRRSFLRGTAAAVSSAAIVGALQMFQSRKADAKGWRDWYEGNPYGDPVPTLDEVTGLPLIGLPPGFRYWTFGWTGDPIFS